jgi:tetratricopeptide (TPR) repeat protein
VEQRENPIEIFTVKDAITALDRKRGSFEEWLECATIFAKLSMWDYLEKAAYRALESATTRPIKPSLLVDAAKRYAAGALGDFKNKSDFEMSCRNTSKDLKKIRESLPKGRTKIDEQLENLTQILDEILILLADGSPEALTSIASRLRKRLGRSDLAIRVADIALRQDSSVIPGYVVRGSALTDVGEYTRAILDLELAERDKKSRPYAIAAHTRLLIRQGKFNDALTKGQELYLRKMSRPLILLMIAAARGANNRDEFERLMKLAESVKDSGKGSGRTLLMRQAVRLLIENGQLDTAKRLIEEISEFDRPSQIKALNQSLQRAIRLHSLKIDTK